MGWDWAGIGFGWGWFGVGLGWDLASGGWFVVKSSFGDFWACFLTFRSSRCHFRNLRKKCCTTVGSRASGVPWELVFRGMCTFRGAPIDSTIEQVLITGSQKIFELFFSVYRRYRLPAKKVPFFFYSTGNLGLQRCGEGCGERGASDLDTCGAAKCPRDVQQGLRPRRPMAERKRK